MASSVRGVNRWVWPDTTSVTQTLLSITYAKCLPSGLQVKAEATLQELRVTWVVGPPFGETVQNCTMPASSFIKNAIREPSGELRSQWRGPCMPGNFR